MIHIYETQNFKFDFETMQYWFKLYRDDSGYSYEWGKQKKLYVVDGTLGYWNGREYNTWASNVQYAYFDYLFLMGGK